MIPVFAVNWAGKSDLVAVPCQRHSMNSYAYP